MDIYGKTMNGLCLLFCTFFLVANVRNLPPAHPPSQEAGLLASRLSQVLDSGKTKAKTKGRASDALPAKPKYSPGPNLLEQVNVSADNGETRLSLKFRNPVSGCSRHSAADNTLMFEFEGVLAEGVSGRFPPLALVRGLTVAGGGDVPLRVKLRLAPDVEPNPDTLKSYDGASSCTVALRRRSSGPRPVAVSHLQLEEQRRILAGLHYERHRHRASSGGSDIHVLRFEPGSREVSLGLELGQDTIVGRERLSSLAGRSKAIAAVNASFFAGNGEPLGLVSHGQRLLSVPVFRRSCFGLFQGRTALLGNPGFSGKVETDFGEFLLDGVNQKGAPGKVLVYTPEFGATTHTKGEGIEMAITNERVVALQEGDTPIPAEGFVVGIRGTPSDAMSRVKFWDKVVYDWGLTPPWDTSDFALGGGPRLVRNGEVHVNWKEERFSRAFATTRAPRTAVGVLDSGAIVLLVADGRDPKHNVGLGLSELAQVMIDLGCKDALNLDGGGSTTMWLEGKVVNRPSDGRERAISSALVLKRTQPAAVARLFGATSDIRGT